MLVATPALVGYTGDMRVGELNEGEIADDTVGEACGEPNVACSKGDGPGSGLNVSGAGLCFCPLLGVASALALSLSVGCSSCGDGVMTVISSEVVDSAKREGMAILPFESLRSRFESMLGRSVGTGGISERLEPTVCVEPLEKREMREAME